MQVQKIKNPKIFYILNEALVVFIISFKCDSDSNTIFKKKNVLKYLTLGLTDNIND